MATQLKDCTFNDTVVKKSDGSYAFDANVSTTGGVSATGAITTGGNMTATGNVSTSGSLFARGGVAARNDVSVSGTTSTPSKVVFPPTDGETLEKASRLSGYVPFSSISEDTWAKTGSTVDIGGSWSQDPNTGSFVFAYSDAYLSGAINTIMEVSSADSRLSLSLEDVVSPRGLVIEAPTNQGPDTGSGPIDVGVGRLHWKFADRSGPGGLSYVSSGVADINGKIPGVVNIKADKLYWNGREIYVDNGVLKLSPATKV